MVRSWLFIVGMVCTVATAASGAAGQALSADDRAAIRAVIESQIAAFQRDDADGAFAFAAPGIRQKFGDAATFIRMVRDGYGPVYRPREVVFRGIDETGALPIQEVLVVGPDGNGFIARYPMQKQPDGGWLIAGCFLSPFDGETT